MLDDSNAVKVIDDSEAVKVADKSEAVKVADKSEAVNVADKSEAVDLADKSIAVEVLHSSEPLSFEDSPTVTCFSSGGVLLELKCKILYIDVHILTKSNEKFIQHKIPSIQ